MGLEGSCIWRMLALDRQGNLFEVFSFDEHGSR
jgi:hypothetical protein